jgi:hypothetical protein
MDKLEKDSLLKSIQKRLEQEAIDSSLPENRFLLMQVEGTGSAAYVLYEDHATTAPEIMVKVFERAPRTQENYNKRPPIDRGAIFDTNTKEILAYRLKAL